MQQPLNLEGRKSGGSNGIWRLSAKCRGNGIQAKAACACSGGGREAVNGPAAENNVRIISETGTDGKQRERVGGEPRNMLMKKFQASGGIELA